MLILLQGLDSRAIYDQLLQQFTNQPLEQTMLSVIPSFDREADLLISPEVLFDSCRRLQVIKKERPGFRMVQGINLDSINPGASDTLYNTYLQVTQDPNPTLRNSNHPLWRQAFS